MKTVFKPLGVAAAVAAVTAGYTSAVTAQEVSSRNVGDLALIPYYTVNEGFATAVHIINTSEHTQVVKLRMRRGRDSMDSLDFNLIMSPKDEWVGSLSQTEEGIIKWTTKDTTCTAPAGVPNGNGGVDFIMPDQESVETLVDFRVGAEEGYIEVIGMGQPSSETEAIAIAAKHVNGVPADCGAVRENFFRIPGADNGLAESAGNPGSVKGVYDNWTTHQTCTVPVSWNGLGPECLGTPGTQGLFENDYDGTQDDALKVSWAVTDANSGLEVGGNAVHIEAFAQDAMITNQQSITLGSVDKLGYLFPDLDGGSPGFADRELYEDLRDILGASSVQNDWSSRGTDAFDVQADWVVTMPGQYLMVDPARFLLSLNDPNSPLWRPCLTTAQAAAVTPVADIACDFRDIPVALAVTYYDREEGEFTPEEGGLVVSPSINLTPDGIVLPYETNVIYWKVDAGEILGSQYQVAFSPQFEEDRGWSNLSVTSAITKEQGIWTFVDPNDPNTHMAEPTDTAVPIIGFAAWERSFADSPDANYGRAVDHSYGSPVNR